MAVGFYRTLECADYDVGSQPERPAVDVTIFGPITGKERSFEAAIDTGFSGFILVPHETYEDLSELEVPASEFLTYSTVTGPVTLKRARVIALTLGKRFETFIECPLAGTTRFLLGRRILREFNVALLGLERRCCTLEASNRRT
jgi:predicted aspartyl protease